MNIQFNKGMSELCILVLTLQKDQDGYELVEQIEQEFTIVEGNIIRY